MLIGALASFGFTEASRICRQIEQIFRAGVESSLEARHLAQLVLALRQELELPAATRELSERSLATVKQQRRILIIDSDAQLGEQLISEATIWGIQAELVTDSTEARKAIAQNCPDGVLLDLYFNNSAENGLNLLAELKTNNRHLPVLVLAAQDDFANRIKVARLGGEIFLPKPAFPASVLAAVTQVLSQSDTIAAKILVVDDDPQTLDILRTVLEPWGFNLALVDNPRHFWDKLEQYNPDLLILDVEMPELSGIDLCQVVRSDSHWCELPVLFLSVHTDPETVNQAFTAGADDYVNKPIGGSELIARVLNRLERTRIRQRSPRL